MSARRSTPEGVRLRRLGPDDTAAVLEASRLFDEPPQVGWTQEFLRRQGHHLVVAYLGGTPAGFVTGVEIAHPDKGLELLVYELGVEEAYQRRGVARALLDELERIARKAGCRGVWVVTEPDNAAALATYRSRGAQAETTVTCSWALG